ncbi:MAG: HDIG domain-containing metalloprotein [Candidatus Bruticola sp.]
MKKINREEAWSLLTEFTQKPELLKHALAVEAVMRHWARLNNEDEELWGVIGLLHDLDYEKYPAEHCLKEAEIMRQRGLDEFYIHAVQSHGFGTCTEVSPESLLEKTLYTIDELTGCFINAVCLVRPSKSILDLEVKSVKKKLKDKRFAANVDRQVIVNGCALLNKTLDDIIQGTIEGMKTAAEALDLKG